MVRSPSFGGVILAAGESSRMGRDKALLPWPPRSSAETPSSDTFLSAAIRSLSLCADFVVVVVGKNEAAVTPVAYANGASVVLNPDPSRGQFSSLQLGLQEVLNRGRDAAIVTLVDRPPVSPACVQILRDSLATAPDDIWAVVPEFSGKHGHPFIAGRELIAAFLRAPATGNAREIEHRYQDHIQYVPVSDGCATLNINTPEDYSALASKTV